MAKEKKEKTDQEKCVDELNQTCSKYGFTLQAIPQINSNGTLGAKIVMKRIEKISNN